MFKPARLVFRGLEGGKQKINTASKQPKTREQLKRANETILVSQVKKKYSERLKFNSQLKQNGDLLNIESADALNLNQMKRLVFLAKRGNPDFQKKIRSLYEKPAGGGVFVIDESLKYASKVRYTIRYAHLLGHNAVFKLQRKNERSWSQVAFNGSYYQRFKGSSDHPKFYGSRVSLLRGDKRVYMTPGQAVSPKVAATDGQKKSPEATKKTVQAKKGLDTIKSLSDLTPKKAQEMATRAIAGDVDAKQKLRALYTTQSGNEIHFNPRARYIRHIMNRKGSYLAFFDKDTQLQGQAYGRGKWSEVRFNSAIGDFDKYYPGRKKFRGRKYWPDATDVIRVVSRSVPNTPDDARPRLSLVQAKKAPRQNLKVNERTRQKEKKNDNAEKLKVQMRKTLENAVILANRAIGSMKGVITPKHLENLKLEGKGINFDEKKGFSLDEGILKNPTRVMQIVQGLDRVVLALHYKKEQQRFESGTVNFGPLQYKKNMSLTEKKAYMHALGQVENAKFELTLGNIAVARGMLLQVLSAKEKFPRAKYIANALLSAMQGKDVSRKVIAQVSQNLTQDQKKRREEFKLIDSPRFKRRKNYREQSLERKKFANFYFTMRANFFAGQKFAAQGKVALAMRKFNAVISAVDRAPETDITSSMRKMKQLAITEKRYFLAKALQQAKSYLDEMENNLKGTWNKYVKGGQAFISREKAIYDYLKASFDKNPKLHDFGQAFSELKEFYRGQDKKTYVQGKAWLKGMLAHLDENKSLVHRILTLQHSDSTHARRQAMRELGESLGLQGSATILAPLSAKESYQKTLSRLINKGKRLVPASVKNEIRKKYSTVNTKERRELFTYANQYMDRMIKGGKITAAEAHKIFPQLMDMIVRSTIDQKISDEAFKRFVVSNNPAVCGDATANEKAALANLRTMNVAAWWDVGSKLAVELLFDSLVGGLVLKGIARAGRVLPTLSVQAQKILKMKGIVKLASGAGFTLPFRSVVHGVLGTQSKVGAIQNALQRSRKIIEWNGRVYIDTPKSVLPADPSSSTSPQQGVVTSREKRGVWTTPSTPSPKLSANPDKKPDLRGGPQQKPQPAAPSAAEKKGRLEAQKKQWMETHMHRSQVMQFFVPPQSDLKPWPKNVYNILKNLETQVHSSLQSHLINTEYFESRSNFYYQENKIGRQYNHFSKQGIDQVNPPRLSRIALSVDGLISFLKKKIQDYQRYPEFKRNAAGLAGLLKRVEATRRQLRRYRYPTNANGLRALRGVAQTVQYSDQYRFRRTQDINSSGPRLKQAAVPELDTVTLKQLDKPKLNQILALAYAGDEDSAAALRRLFTKEDSSGKIRFAFGWNRLGRYAYQKCRFRHIFGQKAQLVIRKRNGQVYQVRFDKNYRNGAYRSYDEKRKRFTGGRIQLLRTDRVEMA